MKTPIYLLILLISASNFSAAQESPSYSKELYTSQNDTLPYRLLLPKNYKKNKKYPLLIFLHGSGERGNDNEAQLVHGSTLFLDQKVRDEFPAIVVFPQCKANASWNSVRYGEENGRRVFNFPSAPEANKQLELVEELMDFFLKNYKIDNERIYLGGLSMGGMGAFELLLRNPDTFAAVFPICGGANPETASTIKNTPLWIFHGAEDAVVPPKYSQDIYQALKKENARVQFTMYPNVGHDSWTPAFAEAQLLPWLFSNKRK